MNVADLIAELEGMDPEALVHFAAQPSYPMEYTVARDVVTRDGVVHLAEGRHAGYLPGDVADRLGW